MYRIMLLSGKASSDLVRVCLLGMLHYYNYYKFSTSHKSTN